MLFKTRGSKSRRCGDCNYLKYFKFKFITYATAKAIGKNTLNLASAFRMDLGREKSSELSEMKGRFLAKLL